MSKAKKNTRAIAITGHQYTVLPVPVGHEQLKGVNPGGWGDARYDMSFIPPPMF